MNTDADLIQRLGRSKFYNEFKQAFCDSTGLPLTLPAGIEWQARDFQARSGVSCVIRVPDEDLRLSRDQTTALFRIFQESLTNVARHAQATKVWVNLSEEEDAVVLEVEDDGVGISPARLAERRSLGLLGMRDRVAFFGGEINLRGCPAKVLPS